MSVPVNAKGVMTDERYNGQFYAKGNDMVVADLEAEGALLAKERITHSYPHCWRCKNPIIFRATPQWFCSVESFKDEAVAAWTYEEMDRQVKRAANFFLELGVAKGELVALQLHNRPEYLVCWLALAQIGAVSVPINAHYQQPEVHYVLEKCGIRRAALAQLLPPAGRCRQESFSISAGTTLYRSPTTPKSAFLKMGADLSLLTATMTRALLMPPICCTWPDTPRVRISSGLTCTPVMPI